MVTNIINAMNRFKCLSILLNIIAERKNKKLMVDKILSYSPMISKGIAKYDDADKNFWLLIILGAILKDYLMISIPCCALAVYFMARMIQFIKYKNIHSMVNNLAKDLLFKGIFNKNKAEHMLKEFEKKYGSDTKEYIEFLSMLDKYEKLVIKIEYILKSVKIGDEKDYCNEQEERCKETDKFTEEDKCFEAHSSYSFDEVTNSLQKKNIGSLIKEAHAKNYGLKREEAKRNLAAMNTENRKQVEWQNISKAIDLFDDEMSDKNKGKAILLKNKKSKDEKLKVYLYKKSSDYEKKIL